MRNQIPFVSLRASLLFLCAVLLGAVPYLAFADESDGLNELVSVEFERPLDIEKILDIVEITDVTSPLIIAYREDEWIGEIVLNSASQSSRQAFIESLAADGQFGPNAVGVTGVLHPGDIESITPVLKVQELDEKVLLEADEVPQAENAPSAPEPGSV